METLIDSRVDSLKDQQHIDLRVLPNCVTETLLVDGKDTKLTTYHNILESGIHRFVIQGIQQRWGGITAKVIAKGFDLDIHGTYRTLPPEELYDYA